jgi:hypothetical protein
MAIQLFSLVLVALIPCRPSSVLAQFIDVTQAQRKISEKVDVFISQLPTPTATIDLYFSNEPTTQGQRIGTDVLNCEQVLSTITTGTGELDAWFFVPSRLTDGDVQETVRGGTYYVCLTISPLDTRIVAVDTLTVENTGGIINLVAETSIAQGLSASTTDVAVLNVIIARIKDPSENSTANITGGISSYSATVSSNVSNSIQFLTVYGVSPFDGPALNATTSVFSVASISSPPEVANTTIAEIVAILTGNVSTSVNLMISFMNIGATLALGLNIPL